MRSLFIAALCLLLISCAGTGPDNHKLDRTLYAYASAIRWGTLEDALQFIDPALVAQLTPSQLDRERAAQLKVTGYDVRGEQPVSGSELTQVVEIRLVNRHTQTERSVTDRQRWRWDDQAKQWWLVSGLPDFSPR